MSTYFMTKSVTIFSGRYKTFNRKLRGLHNAMKELAIDSGIIVTWDDEATLEGNIALVPAWKWLLQFKE